MSIDVIYLLETLHLEEEADFVFRYSAEKFIFNKGLCIQELKWVSVTCIFCYVEVLLCPFPSDVF